MDIVARAGHSAKNDENALNSFERKILRCILGRINENGTWRHRYNMEIYYSFKESYYNGLGMSFRMEKERVPLKILKNEFGGRRPAGRPRNRWVDTVERDINSCWD
ncbi:hypothetical protein C0J52_19029 [Blattella germanica]|nr:hypothetical protein C0J52_19029 [Blattella germanica]